MKQPNHRRRNPVLLLTLGLAAGSIIPNASAQSTWNGGGADTNWSTALNWDVAPAATGGLLVFDGTFGLANSNDLVTSLGSAAEETAFTFAAGAGAFVLSDGSAGEVTAGPNGSNTFLVQQNSDNDQEIALPLKLGGGQKVRKITFGGAGSLTLSGNINFSNDWLFTEKPDGATSGTIILTGDNTGPGKGGAVSAGTNGLRGVFRENVSGNQWVLGSPTCLGEFNVDLANLRGFSMNAGNTTFATSEGLDLVGDNKIDKTITYHQSCAYSGNNDLELGGILNTAGNGRGFSLTGEGDLIISGVGLLMTQRQNAQTVVMQPQGNAKLILNAPIIDCWHSDGLTTQMPGLLGGPVDGSLRMNGSGIMEINADNEATFKSDFRAFKGTTILGHAKALGASGTESASIMTLVELFDGDVQIDVPDVTGIAVGQTVTATGIPDGATVVAIDAGFTPPRVELSLAPTMNAIDVMATFEGTTPAGATEIRAGATIDLNGFTIDETFSNIANGGAGPALLKNDNTSTPAGVTTDMVNFGNPTFGGAGDLTIQNVYRTNGVTRRITKVGTGTLTLAGDRSNSRYGLTVSEGDVILAKTDGEAVNRFPLIMNNAASAVSLQGNEQIGNQTDDNGLHQINEGTLDLNGFDESIGSLSTSAGTEPGGTVTNSDAGTASTLTLLGTTSDATWPGTISGKLNLVKGGANTQTLTGTPAYTGNTTVDGGSLSITAATLDDASAISIATGTTLNLNFVGTDTVDTLTLGGITQAAGEYGAVGTGAANEVDEITGTGLLNVTTGPSANDYDTWAATFLPDDVSDPDGDNDNDGLDNKSEYAFGLSPVDPSSVSPYSAPLDPGTGTMKYTRRNTSLTGLTYSYEASDTLLPDSWTPFTPTESSDGGDPIEEITVTLPGDLLAGPKGFLQITAE